MSLNKQEFHVPALKPGPVPAQEEEVLQRAAPTRPNLTSFIFRHVKADTSNGGNALEPLVRAFLPFSAEQKQPLQRMARGRGEQTEQADVTPVIQIYPVFGLRNKYSAQNTL